MFLFVILTKTKAIIVLWTLFVLKVYTYTYRAHHHYNNNNNIISVMHFCVIVPPSYNIIQQLLAITFTELFQWQPSGSYSPELRQSLLHL